MAKFSDRIGITKPPSEILVGKLSEDLHASLWNLLVVTFQQDWKGTLARLFYDYYKTPLDQVPYLDHECRKWLKQAFDVSRNFPQRWYEAYNLVEHVLQNTKAFSNHQSTQLSLQMFEKRLNEILERELAGYRAINRVIVPITSEQEVEEIQQAASAPSPFGTVTHHINNALILLGKKPDPDYRNSIKESVNAVEGICQLLTGEDSGGLEKPLKELATKISLPSVLQKSFLSLYGYTSGKSGIRHPLLESTEIGFAEAKFMLVTCSAFVNFIIDKARQAKML